MALRVTRHYALPVAITLALGAIFYLLRFHTVTEQTELTRSEGSQSAPVESNRAESSKGIALASESDQQSASVQKLQDHDRWLREIVERLIAVGDGRSLLTAAAIMHTYAPLFQDAPSDRSDFTKRIVELMERAAAKDPSDPVVAIVADAYCLRTKTITCDTEYLDHLFQASDPGNALIWIGALERVTAIHDRAQQVRIVHDMANASRVDAHYLDIENLIVSSIESIRIPVPESATSDSIPITRAVAATTLRFIPQLSLAPLASVCKRPLSESLLTDCRRILELARDAHGNLPAVALSIANEINPQGTEEAQALAGIQRRREWQFIRAMRLPHTAQETRRIMGGDIDAAIDVLTANGIPLEPPADWNP